MEKTHLHYFACMSLWAPVSSHHFGMFRDGCIFSMSDSSGSEKPWLIYFRFGHTFFSFIGFQASSSRVGCWWSFLTSATNTLETATVPSSWDRLRISKSLTYTMFFGKAPHSHLGYNKASDKFDFSDTEFILQSCCNSLQFHNQSVSLLTI